MNPITRVAELLQGLAKKVEADAGGSCFAWRRSGASSAGLFG